MGQFIILMGLYNLCVHSFYNILCVRLHLRVILSIMASSVFKNYEKKLNATLIRAYSSFHVE